MNRKKLGTCLVAALITGVGATYLAQPAQAAASPVQCTNILEDAYAAGYIAGACGSGGGTLLWCGTASDGTWGFNYQCN